MNAVRCGGVITKTIDVIHVPAPRRVGLISDTHGLVRPETLAALTGCDFILHAGDVGKPAVLEALSALAPVFAVRGNNDQGDWAEALPEFRAIGWPGVLLALEHKDTSLRRTASRSEVPYAVIVTGHTHAPSVERRDGTLWVNPGSAGPRRFSLPVAVGYLEPRPTGLEATIVELTVAPPAAKPRLTPRRP